MRFLFFAFAVLLCFLLTSVHHVDSTKVLFTGFFHRSLLASLHADSHKKISASANSNNNNPPPAATPPTTATPPTQPTTKESTEKPEGVICKDGVCRLPPKVPKVTPSPQPTSAPTADDQNDTTSSSVQLQPEVADVSETKEELEAEKVIDDEIAKNTQNTHDDDSSNDDANKSEEITATPLPLPSEAEQAQAIDELCKLGWPRNIATRALQVTAFDVTAAAELLDQESEELTQVQRLVSQDWDEGAALLCLRECQGNETQALDMLHAEESRLQGEFSTAVAEMVEAGWEEIAARTALRMQFSLQQRRSLGYNDTFPREELDKIRFSLRPSLHRLSANPTISNPTNSSSNDKNNNAQKADNNKNVETQKTTKSNSTASTTTVPTVKKEDVIFEGSLASLQSMVLDSELPVVVDIYADWCGPCKQLTPMLEAATLKANGLFRLVKINADKERSVVDALQVTGFPTLFTISQGCVVDKVVGGLPPQQLQTFLVRAVTGYGTRVQAKDVSEALLAELSQRIQSLAGLASITSQKKSLLRSKVDAIMLTENVAEAFVATKHVKTGHVSYEAAEGVRLVSTYLENARRDIRNVTRTTLSTQNKLFSQHVQSNAAALALLELAGFRPLPTDTTKLRLIHHNPAILSLVVQKIEENISHKKFATMMGPSAATTPIPSSGSLRTKKPSSLAEQSVEKKSKTHVDHSKGSKKKEAKKEEKETKKKQSLPATAKSPSSSSSSTTDRKSNQNSSSSSSSSSSSRKKTDSSSSSNSGARRASTTTTTSTGKRGKTHTMLSMGLLQKNDGKAGNEYFNGDSTVMEAKVVRSSEQQQQEEDVEYYDDDEEEEEENEENSDE